MLMEKIYAAFAEYFKNWDLHLPDPLPPKGRIVDKGWTVRYVLQHDEAGQPWVEFLAFNRMTNSSHVRILSSGEVIDLPSLETDYGYDPDVPGAEEAARQRMLQHNAEVEEELKKVGLA